MRPGIPSASGNVPGSTGRQRPSRQRSQSGSRQTPSVALVPAGSAPSTSRPASPSCGSHPCCPPRCISPSPEPRPSASASPPARPARPSERVDRHLPPAFRSVLVIPRRGVAQPAAGWGQGDGAEEQPLADMRRADARSRQIGRRDGVRCRFQLSRQSVEPRPVSRTLSRLGETRRQRVRALPRSRPARRRRARVGRRRRAAGRRGRDGGHRPVPCAARPG